MYRNSTIAFLLTFCSAVSFVASATTVYVSPTGISTAAGTINNPVNFSTAISKSLTGGDSIIVRGGMYNFISLQQLSKSGNAVSYLQIVAYPGEIPILDYRSEPYSDNNQGVKISGNYVHFKGFIIQGAGDNGLQVTGSNNVIEHCTTRWNCDAGTQMKTGSNNLILNCDSYENFDYKSGGIASPDFGGNADGFADKQYTNTGTNTYKGCRSWRNGDDGWDSYQKVGNTVYDSCWCYSMAPATFDMTDNIRFKTDSASWFYQFKNASGRYVMTNYGNGNGFKLGGLYTQHNATVHNCISVSNKVKGFDQNNNAGIMTITNCTSFNNGNNYGFTNNSYGTLVIRNCASLSSKGSNTFNCLSVTQSYNSWNPGFTCVTGDFVNLDATQMLNDRQPDGSLPEITLLHLTPTSGMLDKGIDVGFPFSGNAPDLGAYEYAPDLTANAPQVVSEAELSVFYSSLNHTLSLKGPISSVEIYKITGQEIYAGRFSTNQLSIPAEKFAKGICLVNVVSPQGVSITKKILID
jgi:hypothetical protein